MHNSNLTEILGNPKRLRLYLNCFISLLSASRRQRMSTSEFKYTKNGLKKEQNQQMIWNEMSTN